MAWQFEMTNGIATVLPVHCSKIGLGKTCFPHCIYPLLLKPLLIHCLCSKRYLSAIATRMLSGWRDYGYTSNRLNVKELSIFGMILKLLQVLSGKRLLCM